MNGRSQTGIVGCASIDDYMNNIIKKHEYTLARKEEDRIRHVDTCNANTGPIFLTYRKNDTISNAVNAWANNNEPIYDFVSDSVKQTVWKIDDENTINLISGEFDKISALYIADGHHRCASAVKVGQKRREEKPDFTGEEEFNFFLSVAFPDDELEIMDYNRVVKDLNGMSDDEFITAISENLMLRKSAGSINLANAILLVCLSVKTGTSLQLNLKSLMKATLLKGLMYQSCRIICSPLFLILTTRKQTEE